MKILFVSSSLDDGGVARILSELTLLLPKDWDFDILLVHNDDVRYKYRGNIIGLGVKEPKSRLNLIYAIKVFFKKRKKLKELKKRGEYDVCISFMDSSNVCNILTGNKYCRTVVAVENYMSQMAKYDWKYRYIVNPLIKLFYNKADLVIACSDESCKDLVGNYGIHPGKIQRIYCSIDTNDIKQTAKQNDIAKEDKNWFDKNKTVLTAGRLCKQKGHWHLIRAFSKVVKTIPDAKLVIFGEGELRDYLESQISDYYLEDNVVIHRYTKILPAYISKSAVFTMPSLYEGFPTAMLMAMACETSCIASDFESGSREQLAPGYSDKVDGVYKGTYGLLTMPLDEEMLTTDVPLTKAENSLADAIVGILNDSEMRENYSKKAELRSKEFDSVKICGEWRDTIIKLCKTQ